MLWRMSRLLRLWVHRTISTIQGISYHMSSEACHAVLSTACLWQVGSQATALVVGVFPFSNGIRKKPSGMAERGGQGPAQHPQDLSELRPKPRMGKTQGPQSGGARTSPVVTVPWELGEGRPQWSLRCMGSEGRGEDGRGGQAA